MTSDCALNATYWPFTLNNKHEKPIAKTAFLEELQPRMRP